MKKVQKKKAAPVAKVKAKSRIVKPKTNIPHTEQKSIRNGTKQSILINLLKRSEGATVAELAKATDWQKHSVQGMMSGVLKKRLGFTITSDLEKRGRVYRVGSSR